MLLSVAVLNPLLGFERILVHCFDLDRPKSFRNGRSCLCSGRPDRRGWRRSRTSSGQRSAERRALNVAPGRGNRKGNRASRGVFPLSVFLPAAILTNDRLRPNTLGAFKVSKALTLASAHCRRRSLPPLDIATASPRQPPTRWRVPPLYLPACANRPAPHAVAAHATLAGCHRLRRSAETAPVRQSDPDGISEADRHGFRTAFHHPVFSLRLGKRLTPRGEPRQTAVVGAVRER